MLRSSVQIRGDHTCGFLTCASQQIATNWQPNEFVLAGRFAEGQAQLEAALEAADPADIVTRACLMNNIGFVANQRRRPDEAVGWFQRGLEFDRLPQSAAARLTYNLACSHFLLKQLERAEELARRALALAVAAFGAEHPETLFPQSLLASVHFARGDYTRAEPVYRRVHWLAERNWGANSYEVAVAAGSLAMIYLLQRRFTQAQTLFLQSLNGLQKNPLRANDEIPLTEAGLALSYAASGRTRQAEIFLERAVTSGEAQLDPADPSFAVILERAANARFLLKDYESGRQLFERAISVLENQHGPGSKPVMRALERYAGLCGPRKTRLEPDRWKNAVMRCAETLKFGLDYRKLRERPPQLAVFTNAMPDPESSACLCPVLSSVQRATRLLERSTDLLSWRCHAATSQSNRMGHIVQTELGTRDYVALTQSRNCSRTVGNLAMIRTRRILSR